MCNHQSLFYSSGEQLSISNGNCQNPWWGGWESNPLTQRERIYSPPRLSDFAASPYKCGLSFTANANSVSFTTKGIVLNRGPLFKGWTLLILPSIGLFKKSYMRILPKRFFWLGIKGSNLKPSESESATLPIAPIPNIGWGRWTRTIECRSQSPVPCQLGDSPI